MFQNILFFTEKNFSFFFLFPITKLEKYMFIVFFFILIFFLFSLKVTQIIPSFFQSTVESIYEFLMITINQQSGKASQKMFPFFLLLFNFILFSNMIGLLPFSFTATSHIFQTFSMGLSIIIALTVIGLLIHGLNFFKLFIPSGAPSVLIPLLIVIEIISYVSRAFSLSIRLFANMMSGHTLLNIISSFSVKLISLKIISLQLNFSSIIKFFIFFIGGLLPMVMIGGIFFLELGIGFLQAYVFMVLIGIYLNDSFKGGH
jgi:ATP synthase subunit 6